ncbi:uncharacterized protein DDB_G0283697-like [Palaemon carinicauda]|uniref:uncharacterized protein DDB_G0283697-like n=1 Tax=Palaemon carinicauda TaxID=392227 RepID=UPI0035B58FB7
MGDRDEKGRLKLPDANYVPFQRVLTRSHRGSKNSSRHESPEHTPRKNRSNRQWPSSESKRSIRSHSYNISEYRNTHDDDKSGYYYDGDHENDEDKRHRRKPRHRDPSNDMTKQLNNLSLRNGGRPRSKSLTNGSGNNKMPYIPFQRVLNIRTRQPAVQPERAFRVPAFTGLRERGDFRRSDGYTSEYRSRFNQRQKHSYIKKKPVRGRNDSSLNELLNDRDNYEQSDNEEVDNSYEPSENGDDHDRSNHSRLSRVSKHSHGSNSYDDGTASGHEERSDSSSLVKFPDIQASPRMTIERAKSIEGKGAAPPSGKLSNFQSSDSAMQSPRLVKETTQAIDTSRWVEGKGAGKLSHYFKVKTPQNKNEVNNNNQETLENNEHTEKKVKSGAERNKAPDKEPKDYCKKNLSQKQRKVQQKIPETSNNQIKRNQSTKLLPRSKSDSALLHGTKFETINSRGPIQHLKPNEIIIFKENGEAKSVKNKPRPRTSLPKIVLTMAEDQNSSDPKTFLEKSTTKNIQKGTYQATAIPNLPNISFEQNNNHSTSFKKTADTPPVSIQLEQKLNNKFENSIKKKTLNLKKPLKVKKKLAIGTLHKSYAKQNRKTKVVRKIKHKMNIEELQLQSFQTQNQNFLQVTKHHIGSAKLRVTKQEINVTPKRFSKKTDNIPQVNQSTLNEKLPTTPDQGTSTELTRDIQNHIENIRQQRSKRLQRFSHFLRPKNKAEEIII